MPGASLPAPVASLVEAVNAGDTDAFLATFAAAGLVNDWGREFRGHPAIKGWSDNEFIGAHCRLTVTSVAEEGGRTVVIADVRSTGFNGPTTFTFEVDGDTVAAMLLTA